MSSADAKIPEKAQLRLAEKVEASGGAAAFAAALTAPESASETATSNPDQGGNVTDQAKNETDQPVETAADPAADVSVTDRGPSADEAGTASSKDVEPVTPEDRTRPGLGPLPALAVVAEGDYGDELDDAEDGSSAKTAEASGGIEAALSVQSETAEIRVSDDDDVLDDLDIVDEDAISRQVTIVPTGKTPLPAAPKVAIIMPPVAPPQTADRRPQTEQLPAPSTEPQGEETGGVVAHPTADHPMRFISEKPVELSPNEEEALRKSNIRNAAARAAADAEDAVAIREAYELAFHDDLEADRPPVEVKAEAPAWEPISSQMPPDFETMKSPAFESVVDVQRADGSYHVPSDLLWLFLHKLTIEAAEADDAARENLLCARQVAVNELFARGEGLLALYGGKFTRQDITRFIGECHALIESESGDRKSALGAAFEPAAEWSKRLLELEERANAAKAYTTTGRTTQGGNTPPGEPVVQDNDRAPERDGEEPAPSLPDPFIPPPAKLPVAPPPVPSKSKEPEEARWENEEWPQKAFFMGVGVFFVGLIAAWLLLARSHGSEVFSSKETKTPSAAASAQK